MTEEKLEQAVAQVKDGNIDAFRVIVDETLVVLRSYIGFFIRDAQQVDDTLQETYLQLFRRIREYEAGTAFMAWAKTIARFQALGHLRSQQRKQDARQRYTDEVHAQIAAAVADDEAAFPLERRMKALVTCLESLSGKAKEMVQQRYFKGMSIDDMAAALNLKSSAVGMTLHRTRAALAECVEKSL
jgi:RNA polymerase sigma-70 factor, ECF subfamily